MKYPNAIALCALIICFVSGLQTAGQTTNIAGPAGSGQFGTQVYALPNGNIVVTDPNYSFPAGAANVGAVYLYNGATGALISALTGSTAGDQVGSAGVVVLTNGNYVVRSPNWDAGAVANVGAVTFCSGATGLSGTVSAANSLVGSTIGDVIGNAGVTALANGNYVVGSPGWDNALQADAGAATFCSGTTGRTGAVSAANSLVGSTAGDFVGISVTALTNGNYVVGSTNWDNGAAADAGAATFGSGTTGRTGAVSAANSLVGSSTNDIVGGTIVALTNGSYVVPSPNWDNGAIANAGAATFGSGTSGVAGTMSAANSLVGSSAGDNVGGGGATALANGNYVVSSPSWGNGAITSVGAATFASGTTGITGPVTAANSLVGSTGTDQVSSAGVTALTNGNYVVASPNWDNGALANAGAATFGSGTSGVAGTISAANSLVGSTGTDQVSSGGVAALATGNYVVRSPNWDAGAVTNVGAATFASGTTGRAGTISAANSLVGSSTSDNVGNSFVVLTNGNYVVGSRNWDNGAIANAGAATFGNGTSGVAGTISAANSLVGSTANDNVGNALSALANGNYVVRSFNWDNGAIVNAGAVTRGNGLLGVAGTINSGNSVIGTAAGGGPSLSVAFDAVNSAIVVGRPADNVVTLFRAVAPSAAGVSLSGRVLGGKFGVARALVTVTDAAGNVRSTRSNTFGYYRFEGLAAGGTYTLEAAAKGYEFAPRVVGLSEDLADFDIAARE